MTKALLCSYFVCNSGGPPAPVCGFGKLSILGQGLLCSSLVRKPGIGKGHGLKTDTLPLTEDSQNFEQRKPPLPPAAERKHLSGQNGVSSFPIPSAATHHIPLSALFQDPHSRRFPLHISQKVTPIRKSAQTEISDMRAGTSVSA